MTSQIVQSREFSEAVRIWNSETVEKILKNGGVDVDMIISEKDGRSAIMLAAAADQPTMVRTLLKFKASTTAKDKNGMTALFLACSHGNYEVMKLLVKAFADVNAKAYDGTPMLLTPAQKGFSMVTQYMLENGANPNIANEEGVTPLMAASRKGQRDVVKVLLENGADITLVSVESSRTALQEAIENDHQQIVPLLIKATKEAKEKSQRLFDCKSAEDVRSLIRDGNVKIDERRGDQATPLIVQVEAGNEEVVNELLVQGANVDLQDKDGESALMKACARGHVNITQLIISHRAILDLKSKLGYTALMYGVKQDDVCIVSELLLAGADPTIRNKNGQTALELAKEIGSTSVIDEIMKHSAVADTKDPFINLLSGYLEKVTAKGKQSKSTALVPTRATKSSSRESSLQVAVVGESDPLREQLSKSWKRIADLETRVHDLTLQTTMEFTEEVDLTYYDRARLESEFKKLRELKHKAEQYAIEAKQTAQRLSAENFKLKEDLSREQHINELEKKNMLREMEAKIGEKGGVDEREEAKKEVMQLTIRQRATELASSMGGGSPLDTKVMVDYEMIKELTLNQTITVNLLLLVTPGLPYSGKSTVLRKIFNSNAPLEPEEHLGFTKIEGAVLSHKLRKTSQWMIYDQQQELLLAMTLLREKNQFLDSQPSEVKTIFGDAQLDQCFIKTNRVLPESMRNNDDIRWMLTTGEVSFINAWDLGMNRGVFDLLTMLVPQCENTILLTFFSLKNDADTIDEIPNLADPCYRGRYSQRNDAQQLMRLRTKLETLYYPLFVVPESPCLLVATHPGLPKKEVDQKSKHVFQKVKTQIEFQEDTNVSVPKLVPVEFDKRADALQRNLEEIITNNPKYTVQLPLKWGFLRAFLEYTKKLYVTLPQLKKIANKLHITNGEVGGFLKMFMKFGSLIHVTGNCPECSDEFVIVRPAEFLKEVGKLYYIQDNDEIRQDLKKRASLGYISWELADMLWPTKRSDASHRTSVFFIYTLRRLGVLIPIPTREKDGHVKEFFVPRIRPNAHNIAPQNDSLFMLHGEVFPYPLQSGFLTHFQQIRPDLIEFDPCNCFNTLRFKTKPNGNHLTLNFMRGYIELSGRNFSKEIRCAIKTACVEVMATIQRQKPNLRLKYNFAVRCPNAQQTEKSHFINFHPLEFENKLFCYKCMGMVELREGSLEWIQAKYTDPKSLVKYEEDILHQSEIQELVESLATLSFDEFSNLASALGFSRTDINTRKQCTPSRVVLFMEILLEFSNRTQYHVKKRLGQVLMNNGHCKEALKIYPAALQSCLYNCPKAVTVAPDATSTHGPIVSDHSTPMSGFTQANDDCPTHCELRLLSMHMPDWEELGLRLNVDKKLVDQYKQSHRTLCEQAYEMLVHWLEEKEGDIRLKTRNHLIKILNDLGYHSAASFLMFCETDHYWK